MNNISKLIATAIASGAIVAGGMTAQQRLNCDFIINYEGNDICITQEIQEAVSSNLQPNQGFGGVQFK